VCLLIYIFFDFFFM